MKRCSKCKMDKPLDRFHADRRHEDGKQSQCNDCYRAWRSSPEQRARRSTSENGSVQRRRWQLSTKYGMTVEQYDRLLEFQGGVCAVCGAKPQKRYLNVDHCHATGQVRGLCCNYCNTRLQAIEGDLYALLLAYLADPPATRLVARTY